MARKTPRKLIALSGSAIAAIYLAGYAATRGADASLNAAPVPSAPGVVATATATARALAPALTPTLAPSPTRAAASATPTAAAAATTSLYKDGTFTGSGTSRRGGFDVAVTVQAGKITGVQITRAWTQYPASRVAALPGQVVARQSAQVDRVSGATYSVQAFQQAVQQALAQATVGSSKTGTA